jgi:hypothetical protein
MAVSSISGGLSVGGEAGLQARLVTMRMRSGKER